jgi:hypothetical protein
MLDCVYRAVSWQHIDQIHYNMNERSPKWQHGTLIGSWLWIIITKHGFQSQPCKPESIFWIQSTPWSAAHVSPLLLLLWFYANSFSIHSALKLTPQIKASGVKLVLLAGYEMSSPCPPPTPSSDPLNMGSGDIEQYTLTCECQAVTHVHCVVHLSTTKCFCLQCCILFGCLCHLQRPEFLLLHLYFSLYDMNEQIRMYLYGGRIGH